MVSDRSGIFSLPYNFFWVFVRPKSQKSRLAQFPGGGPLTKGNLCHQLWLDPMDIAIRHCVGGEWGISSSNFFKLARETTQHRCVIAGSDFARVNQLSRFVIADKQCSKADSLALGIGVASDYEFLLIEA